MPEIVSISFNDKNVVYKNDYYILHITFFITNHIVFKKFCYLLLFYKLLVKTKRHISILMISNWGGIMTKPLSK